MKTKEGFRLRTLGNDFILTAEGLELVDFNKMISFNKTAAFLWEKVSGREFTVEDIANFLIEEYEISEELANHDAQSLVKDWIEAGVVEE